MKERTLAIIKPDIVQQNLAGQVIDQVLSHGFEMIAMKMVKLTQAMAGEFYAIHKGRPFYDDLVEFMTETRVIALVLEKENAVKDLRLVVGATDPDEADAGTIRKRFGTNKGRNAIHASDSVENAQIEAGFFFSNREIIANMS